MKKIISKSSKKQIQFWIKAFQNEVESMEKSIAFKKELIEQLKKSLKQKKSK